ncbi:MAG: DEAD/DEAH box helicase, partial [Verrucomicrobiota bacterium]
MPDSASQLLSIAASAKSIAAKLRDVENAKYPIAFSHVIEPAQAFLVAALAHHISKTIWVVCPNPRSQESLYETLLNWSPNALFLPEAEFAAVENILPDPEIAAERLALLTEIERQKTPHLIVATRAGLEQGAPSPGALHSALLAIRRGATAPMERVIETLAQAGYERVAQVTTRGHFAVRGGILDLFSWQTPRPIRAEFFGDEVESLREFDIDTQTSVRNLQRVDVLLAGADEQTGQVRDYIAREHLRVAIEPEANDDAEIRISESWLGSAAEEDFGGSFQDCEIGDFAVGDFMLVEAKRTQFVARLQHWQAQQARIAIYFQTGGEIERFREIMPATALEQVELLEGTLARGFCFADGNLVLLAAAELFGRYPAHGRRRLQRAEKLTRSRVQIDFSELNEGDLIVHLEHGVGRYLELMSVPTPNGATQDVLALEFANDSKLYVPLEQAYLVSRYVGVGKKSPPLSSLADAKWSRAKKNAVASIFDYAAKMLSVQAERETQHGYATGPDTKWQSEFEHSFPYRETPDQLTAIAATKRDMEQPRPMDRLICGDVGFGKTEVAIRAAFKTVMDGKQVAVLTPTTILAQQHFETFRQRMLDYPVRIEMLSRFRSPAEQRKVLRLLRDGGIDIVIGTHRLISGDVLFKDLGLVVIDEEQRFGVLHKEKFKELFKLVDVLTLSATPIPRTLYLSLVGVKDMSTIETPPLNRLPVETIVCGYDERIIRDAINRELERQGQVYFLHNRVQSIEKTRERIAELCPQARVDFGHGQMDADDLESVMTRFVAGEIDVLVCTTIIESGLDIPNANTIIIDRADRFGLADLYQLRGRVGRAEHKAYAYLLLPREMMTVGAARKRINAIKQYSSLGAGFRIA